MKQSIYVDGVVLGGPGESECIEELQAILERFPAKRINSVEKAVGTESLSIST